MSLYEIADLVLKTLVLFGGVFALWRWVVEQRWRRYERLDEFIESFEKDEMIGFATQVLDWSRRTVVMSGGQAVKFSSSDVAAALRIHTEADSQVTFPDPQDKIRDAFDAILAFFGRLESAIANGFIDEDATLDYFGYWLERMNTMSEHKSADSNVENKMRRYEDKYGPGRTTMDRLYERMATRIKVWAG